MGRRSVEGASFLQYDAPVNVPHRDILVWEGGDAGTGTGHYCVGALGPSRRFGFS